MMANSELTINRIESEVNEPQNARSHYRHHGVGVQIGLRDCEPLHDANEPCEGQRVGRALARHAGHARVPKGSQEHLG